MSRRLVLPRERVPRWLDNFADRHGAGTYGTVDGRVRLIGADGAVALIAPVIGTLEPGSQPETLLGQLQRERTVGVIMLRKGGHAVGLFDGARLLRHVRGGTYVQGRTKAGGWSQQRYARRRDNQARRAYAKATEDVVRLLTDHAPDFVVCAGDRPAITAVWADPRLRALAERWDGQVHPCPEPRLRALEEFGQNMLGVTIDLDDAAQA